MASDASADTAGLNNTTNIISSAEPTGRTGDPTMQGVTRKFGNFFKAIKLANVEVAVLCHMIAFKMFYLNLQNIFLEQACRVNLNYSDEICDNLKNRDTENSTDAEVAVQQYVASIIRWKSLIDNFFPLIFVIFAGAWSDIYGRKLLMVLPIFGYLAQTIGVLFCLGNPNTSAYTVAVVASLPVALTGSIATFNLAIFSYIADMTPLGSRTVRTGITNAAYLMGMSSGNALGGFLSSTSFVGVLAISGILDAIAFIWILFIIQNDTPRRLNKLNSSQQNKGMLVKVKRIFHFKNVLEAVRTVLKRRDGNDRLKIFMLIFACYFFITVPEYGEEAIFYLFLRFRLNWDGQDYGYFATYKLLVGFIGGVLAIGLLSYKLKFSDPLVGLICSVSQLSACFVYAFAHSTAMMFLGPAVDMWNSTMSLITKVMISKIVPETEIGKIYSFMGCVDALIPLIANPLYTTVYKATFEHVLPGLFFFISAVMTIPPFAVFGWLMSERKRFAAGQLADDDETTDEATTATTGSAAEDRQNLHSNNDSKSE